MDSWELTKRPFAGEAYLCYMSQQIPFLCGFRTEWIKSGDHQMDGCESTWMALALGQCTLQYTSSVQVTKSTWCFNITSYLTTWLQPPPLKISVLTTSSPPKHLGHVDQCLNLLHVTWGRFPLPLGKRHHFLPNGWSALPHPMPQFITRNTESFSSSHPTQSLLSLLNRWGSSPTKLGTKKHNIRSSFLC